MLITLAVLCCLLSIFISSVFAEENGAYYYYKVKTISKVEGDVHSEALSLYYALHGVRHNGKHFVMTYCDAEGNPAHNIIFLQPGITEQTDIQIFRSEEPLIGVKLILDGLSSPGLSFDGCQYYLDLSAQAPGLENATVINQMSPIEGFKDGGQMILGAAGDMTFVYGYNAPPVFSGVENDGVCFTTQQVRVRDENLLSVTLDGEPVEIHNGEALVTLPGDTQADYTITASDDFSTAKLTVTMRELDELMLPVSGIDENNVQAIDKFRIQAALSIVHQVSEQEPNGTAVEKAKLSAMEAELENLLSRISEAKAYKNNESISETKDITAENVKLSDHASLEKAEAALKTALNEYSGNYSDSERMELEEDLARVSDALKVVAAMIAALPRTGDDSRIALWLALFVSAAAAMTALKRRTE